METGRTDTGRLVVGPALEKGPPALPPAQYTLGERLAQLRVRVEVMTREDPLKSLAIALAAGWVTGKLLHLAFARRARRPEEIGEE